MFVGHYAASFAIKPLAKDVPLWFLFIAAQFLDILFFPFAVAGIESFRLVPHFTESTHFELPFMPYTHSLLGALLWSAAGFAFARIWFGRRVKRPTLAAFAVALAIFSHWLLDLIVHTPDLPLAGNDTLKLGFGLWNHVAAAYVVEALLLIGALVLYLRQAPAAVKSKMTVFVLVLLAINAVNMFGPPIGHSVAAFSAMALVSYFGFAAVVFWIEHGAKGWAEIG